MDTLFFVKYDFLLEVLIAEAILLISKPRRRYFIPALAGFLSLGILVSSLWPTVFIWHIVMPKFLVIFLVSLVMVFSLFRISFKESVFLSLIALTIQQAGYVATLFFFNWFKDNNILPLFRDLIIMIPLFMLTRLVFNKFLKKQSMIRLKNFPLFLISCIILIMSIIMSFVVFLSFLRNGYNPFVIYTLIYEFISFLLVLALQYFIFGESELVNQIDSIENLWHTEQKQYRLAEESIELLNMRYHDLKHLVTNPSGRDVSGILDRLNEYQCLANTGNKALDVVLTQKSLFCSRHHISFSYMVDGDLISFLPDSEIYALFGNILDNGIESSLKIESSPKRIVSLSLKRERQFILIHCDNYYEEPIQFKNGFPVSGKKEKSRHGFGLRSIRYIVEKYRGNVTVKCDENIFNLNILIPLPS